MGRPYAGHGPGNFPVYTWWKDAPADGTQPLMSSTVGVSITPSTTAHADSSYVQLFSSATIDRDVWFLAIGCTKSAENIATARDMLLTIGVDPAGGSSYSAFIEHLIISRVGAESMPTNPDAVKGSGYPYYFPIHIQSGSSIGVRVRQSGTSSAAVGVWARVLGDPAYPEMTWKGSRCESIGVVAASSRGTAYTPGTTSDGTWTSLGTTANAGNRWFQCGAALNDTTVGTTAVLLDIGVGDASNKRLTVQSYLHGFSSNETGFGCDPHYPNGTMPVPSGTNVYIRGQSASAIENGTYYGAAYAVS